MLLAADNLHIVNPHIERAVQKRDPGPIVSLVKRCEQAGADLIDINTGPLGKDAGDKMAFIIKTVQEATSLNLIIDTANPHAMRAGLEAAEKKPIINGFSLEPEKLEKILPLAAEFKTDIVAYLLNKNSHVPENADEKLTIATELLNHAEKAGVPAENLIIDPVIAPLTWDNGVFQATEVLKVLKLLPDIAGFPVRTITGVSNLTTGKAYKEKKLLLERSYLSMLAASGLTIALLNIFHEESVKTAHACNVFSSDKIFTWEEVRE